MPNLTLNLLILNVIYFYMTQTKVSYNTRRIYGKYANEVSATFQLYPLFNTFSMKYDYIKLQVSSDSESSPVQPRLPECPSCV